MKGPAFWYAREGREAAPVTRALLTPLSWAYSWAGEMRRRRAEPARAPVPVICVGNLTLGGTGKTPVARELLRRLRAHGVRAAALSRGYGGRLEGPVRVDPGSHTAIDVGDEPLMLAADGPAYAARERADGAALAARDGAAAIVMDDGFQNPSLIQDLRIVVIDAEAGYGNGRVFPAGPLREPVPRGLARAHAVVLMTPEPDTSPDRKALGLAGFSGPVLTAWLAPEGPPPAGPLVAFAGIGRPQKFFDALARNGAALAEAAPYPDHHVYTQRDLERLRGLAAAHGARLVTTEKDHARLPAEFRAEATPWRVSAQFADPAGLEALLAPLMDAAPGGA